jgi:hypothetical protein
MWIKLMDFQKNSKNETVEYFCLKDPEINKITEIIKLITNFERGYSNVSRELLKVKVLEIKTVKFLGKDKAESLKIEILKEEKIDKY